jgi:predicted DNA-binding transcriptional regulator AlpA
MALTKKRRSSRIDHHILTASEARSRHSKPAFPDDQVILPRIVQDRKQTQSELLRILAQLLNQCELQPQAGMPSDTAGNQCGSLADLSHEIAQHRILATGEAAAFCGFSVAHWRRLYRTQKVPKPIQLSTRKLGWRVGDLISWLQARVDSS